MQIEAFRIFRMRCFHLPYNAIHSIFYFLYLQILLTHLTKAWKMIDVFTFSFSFFSNWLLPTERMPKNYNLISERMGRLWDPRCLSSGLGSLPHFLHSIRRLTFNLFKGDGKKKFSARKSHTFCDLNARRTETWDFFLFNSRLLNHIIVKRNMREKKSSSTCCEKHPKE